MKKGASKSLRSYEKQAQYYDEIYAGQDKDYQKEAEQIRQIIEKHKKASGNKLLDVGCGTGGHFPFLKEWYTVEGLDIDEDMLKVAQERHPDITFHNGDMVNFDLGTQFDVVTCLFSAIGYAHTIQDLQSAIKSLAKHTKSGGIVVVEPWLSPEQWKIGRPAAVFVDKPDMKLARMNISEREGDLSVINFHFLVATEGKVEHFTEMHKLRLFKESEYMEAFEKAGLKTIFDPKGITGRGLYIGVKS